MVDHFIHTSLKLYANCVMITGGGLMVLSAGFWGLEVSPVVITSFVVERSHTFSSCLIGGYTYVANFDPVFSV